MAFNIDPCTFECLSVAKDLYDHDLLDRVLEKSGSVELCEDYYSLAWDGIVCVFADFRQYFVDETQVETMVFFDPVITEFYELCALYDAEKDITKDLNPFRREIAKDVYQCFTLSSYDFDVRVFDGSRGRPRVVFLDGEEFYGHSELPGALMEVRNTFESYCRRLKKELTKTALGGIPLRAEIQIKEAA